MSCHPIAYQPNISSSALQAMFLCHVFFIVSKFSCVSVRSRSHNVFSCMWGTCNSVINTSHMPQGACTFSFCHTSDTLVLFQYNSKEKSTWNYYFPIFNIVFLAKYEGNEIFLRFYRWQTAKWYQDSQHSKECIVKR